MELRILLLSVTLPTCSEDVDADAIARRVSLEGPVEAHPARRSPNAQPIIRLRLIEPSPPEGAEGPGPPETDYGADGLAGGSGEGPEAPVKNPTPPPRIPIVPATIGCIGNTGKATTAGSTPTHGRQGQASLWSSRVLKSGSGSLGFSKKSTV